MNQQPETLSEIAHDATQAVKGTVKSMSIAGKNAMDEIEEMTDELACAGKDTAHCATEKAKDIYHSAKQKAGDQIAASKEYMRRNPVPILLGAIAFGVAIGYVLLTPRRKPTFSERYANEPLSAVRDAMLSAIAPVTQRVHHGYDTARDGAGKVMERMHHLGNGRKCDSFSDQVGRIGNHLKFW